MERKVHFYSGAGLKLTGIVSTPSDYEEGGGKRPGIVICQGPGVSKDLEAMTKDSFTSMVSNSWLAAVGYVVLRFCYRGSGESEGLEYRLIPLEQVEDIGNAITFLEQQEEVDASCIGLLGLATGGANVSYVAGIDPRVKCMVSVSGMGDCGRWMRSIRRYWEWKDWLKILDEDRVNRVLTGKSSCVETKEVIIHDPETVQSEVEAKKLYPQFASRKRLLSLESAEALLNFQPESVVDKISPRAAMWICAGNDTLVPNWESRSMYEKAGEPKKLVIIEEEKHHGLYYTPSLERWLTQGIEWFNTHLKAG